MAQQSSILPVNSCEANKALALSGLLDKLTDIEKKIINLKDLIGYLETAIREAETAASDEVFYARAVVACQAVEIISKVVVEVIAGKIAGTAMKATGEVVEGVLNATGIIAESVNKAVLDGGSEGYIHATIETNKSTIKEYSVKGFEQAGKKTAATAVGRAFFAYEIVDKSMELYKTLTENKDVLLHGASATGTGGMRKGMISQLNMLKAKVIQLEKKLADENRPISHMR